MKLGNIITSSIRLYFYDIIDQISEQRPNVDFGSVSGPTPHVAALIRDSNTTIGLYLELLSLDHIKLNVMVNFENHFKIFTLHDTDSSELVRYTLQTIDQSTQQTKHK